MILSSVLALATAPLLDLFFFFLSKCDLFYSVSFPSKHIIVAVSIHIPRQIRDINLVIDRNLEKDQNLTL